VAHAEAAQTQERALVQLDTGSSQDMALRLADMERKLDLVHQFFKKVMEKDVDYGVIPGTPKPSLYKPGAEKLCELYNFAITLAEKDEEKDLKTGYYRARIVVRLVHRATGTVIAEGIGEASSYESKYRYRWVFERDIPRGLDKDSLLSKEFEGRNGPYYKYRVENTDLFDQWNTVLKMAKKRALVDATLSATRSSGIFSQAEDELDAWIEGEFEEVDGQQEGRDGGERPVQSQGQGQPRQNGAASGKANRGPSNPGAPATEKQIGAIFGAGKAKGLSSGDVKDLVYQQVQKEVNALTMGEASDLIGLIQKTSKSDLLAMISGVPEDEPPSLFGGGQP